MWKPLIRFRKKYILRPKFYFWRKALIRGLNGPSKKEFYEMYEKERKILLDAERRGEKYDTAHARGAIRIMEELMHYGTTEE